MPTIKLTAEGKVITKDGKPSCTCCTCCNYEILEIGAFIVAGPGDTGYFTIQNNCTTEINFTSYNGVGSPYPAISTIPAGESRNYLVFFFGAEWRNQPFTVTSEECGVSEIFYWPSDYTGDPSWL
jgi:hypothetical protein